MRHIETGESPAALDTTEHTHAIVADAQLAQISQPCEEINCEPIDAIIGHAQDCQLIKLVIAVITITSSSAGGGRCGEVLTQ